MENRIIERMVEYLEEDLDNVNLSGFGAMARTFPIETLAACADKRKEEGYVVRDVITFLMDNLGASEKQAKDAVFKVRRNPLRILKTVKGYFETRSGSNAMLGNDNLFDRLAVCNYVALRNYTLEKMIVALIEEGYNTSDIVARLSHLLGVSRATIYRVKKKLEEEWMEGNIDEELA